MLGKDEIATLKPNAIVLNAARGDIIDDTALAMALKENRILGAGIDVFAEEPLRADNVYTDCDTAILTPHSAGMSLECAKRMAIVSVQNVLDLFDGNLDHALTVNAKKIGL